MSEYGRKGGIRQGVEGRAYDEWSCLCDEVNVKSNVFIADVE